MSDPGEAERRRKRTHTYLGLWGVDADLDAVPVVELATVRVRTVAEVAARAKSLCLVALKAQGLSQHEVFAFADAYEVWDGLTLAENDFVLDPAPERADEVQFAWRYEGLWVLEWALGLVRHLAFPDEPCDHAEAAKRCIESIAASGAPTPRLRADKELLDGADVSRVLDALAATSRAQGHGAGPGTLHHGVAHEREVAFGWLCGGD